LRQTSAELARREAGDLLEAAREVKLVAEPQALCDRPHGQVGLLEQGASGVDPTGAR
jgi:hypothetical protein